MLLNHRTPVRISVRSWHFAAAAIAAVVVAACGSQPYAPIATPMVVGPSGGPVWTPPEPKVEESAPAPAPAPEPPAAEPATSAPPEASAAASASAPPAKDKPAPKGKAPAKK